VSVVADRVGRVCHPVLDHSDAEPVYPIVDVTLLTGRRSSRRRIPDVRAGDRPEHPCRDRDRIPEDADVVERRGQVDEAEPGHRSVCRLQPDDPAVRAGIRTLPPVSLPSAASSIPAATAAPLPLEEPPGIRPAAAGLSTGPWAHVSLVVKKANSSMLVVALGHVGCRRIVGRCRVECLECRYQRVEFCRVLLDGSVAEVDSVLLRRGPDVVARIPCHCGGSFQPLCVKC
jgi:hypothetical protein